jgi:hypothetical protein
MRLVKRDLRRRFPERGPQRGSRKIFMFGAQKVEPKNIS